MTTTAYTASEIISISNVARQAEGLDPLHPNDLLTQAAHSKAAAMVAAKSWSHNTPNQTAWQFLDLVGYRYSVAGENLARNFETPTAVIDAWLNSPSHRNNLLSPQYTQIGVAVVSTTDANDNPILVVQYLATPLTSAEISSSPFNPTETLEGINYSISPRLIIFPILISLLILWVYTHRGGWRNFLTKKTKSPHLKHWRY